MSFMHGNQAILKVDNSGGTLTDVSAYTHDVQMSVDRDDVELPVIGGGAISRLMGPYKTDIAVSTWMDPAIDLILESAVLATTPATRSFEYYPQGSATSGLPKYSGEVWITSYEPETDAEKAGEAKSKWVVDGTLTRGTTS